MKVLLVEDSQHLQTYVKIGLEREGLAVDVASDGDEALWFVDGSSYDVIILDIMLPKRDGLSVLTTLRKNGDESHILLLTAMDKVEDRVQGLQLGADDYLTKPFDMSELIARIQALTRRSYGHKSPLITIGNLTLDTASKKVIIGEDKVNLTNREYIILEYLAMRRGEVVSRSEIEEHMYDMNADIMSNVVNSTISIVRKKLSQFHLQHLITTHRGMGYSLDNES